MQGLSEPHVFTGTLRRVVTVLSIYCEPYIIMTTSYSLAC